MQFKLTIILILFIGPTIEAQIVGLKKYSTSNPLRIGERIPDIEFSDVMNCSKSKVKLSDFNGKLIILDFWDKYCASCIAAFPKMEKLQHEFDEYIQVLLVTYNKMDEVKNLFQKSPILKQTKLPFIFNDTLLHKYFPHTTVPYHVWVDESRNVKLLASGYNTTRQRILKYISDKVIDLKARQDLLDFDDHDYLMTEGDGRQLKYLQYSSVIMNRLDGVFGSGTTIIYDTSVNQAIGVRMINMPILYFFQTAYSFPHKERIVLDVKDQERLIKPNDINLIEEWKKKNTYCYELRVPARYLLPGRSSAKIMQQDLERFFGITACKEKRKLECLALIRITEKDKIKTKVSISDFVFEKTQEAYIFKHANLLGSIEKVVNDILGDLVILDETKYDNKVDMEINANLHDLPSIRMELKKYGLDLIKVERELETLVLKDINE